MNLTGATAWHGDPPSSLSEAPSSTASTPKTTKTTTEKRRNLGAHPASVHISNSTSVTHRTNRNRKKMLIKIFRTEEELLYLIL